MVDSSDVVRGIYPPEAFIQGLTAYLGQIAALAQLNPLVIVLLIVTVWIVKEYIIENYLKWLPNILSYPIAIGLVVLIYPFVLVPIYDLILKFICSKAGVCVT